MKQLAIAGTETQMPNLDAATSEAISEAASDVRRLEGEQTRIAKALKVARGILGQRMWNSGIEDFEQRVVGGRIVARMAIPDVPQVKVEFITDPEDE
jgi:hypothetical protein